MDLTTTHPTYVLETPLEEGHRVSLMKQSSGISDNAGAAKLSVNILGACFGKGGGEEGR